MPELLIELFSEEIPARMQSQAGENLLRLLTEALAPLHPQNAVAATGPRRIAASLNIDATVPGRTVSERGPREGAPDKALDGFTRKHGVTRDALTLQNGFWVLEREEPAVSAQAHIAAVLPDRSTLCDISINPESLLQPITPTRRGLPPIFTSAETSLNSISPNVNSFV